MDDGNLIIEAIKVGGLPSGLLIVLWFFIQRWFAMLDKELKTLKDAFGSYKVKTEGRLTRLETKAGLPAPQEAAHGN